MTDNRQKVLQQIDANKDKSLKFLQKIVSIPSVTGDEGAIQKFLADYLTKMGLEVDMWETDWEALKKHPGYIPVDRGYEGRPNIVATWKGTGGASHCCSMATPTSFQSAMGKAGATIRG